MTVIAAVVKNGRAAIACDTQVSGWVKGQHVETKVVGYEVPGGFMGRPQPFAYVGVCGSAAAIQILKGLESPEDDSDGSWLEFLDRSCTALRQMFKEDPNDWSQFLAVTRNSIHDVNPSGVFQFNPGDKVRIGASGSGGHVALGRMREYLERYTPWTPSQAVHAGVKAAIEIAEGCGGEIQVYKI